MEEEPFPSPRPSTTPSPPPSAYKPPSVPLLKDCGFSHDTPVPGKQEHFLAQCRNLDDFQRGMEELQVLTGSAFAIDGKGLFRLDLECVRSGKPQWDKGAV